MAGWLRREQVRVHDRQRNEADRRGPDTRAARWLILRALLRAFLAATLLVALYYVLPMDRPLDTHTVVLLVLCLAVLAALLIVRIRAITTTEYPGLRALETVAAVVPLYILAFAATYFLAERADSAYFSQPLSRTGALYFSVTVFSTVGFGDITAKADPARLIVTAQMFFDSSCWASAPGSSSAR